MYSKLGILCMCTCNCTCVILGYGHIHRYSPVCGSSLSMNLAGMCSTSVTMTTEHLSYGDSYT